MAGIVAAYGVGTEGVQRSGAQTDIVFTFNCFSLAQHLKLPLQPRKLLQYGAGTGKKTML